MSRSAARARAGHDRTSLYSEITDKIIAELEAGRVPWVQPWGTSAAKAPIAMPKNAATQRRYTPAINVLILWGAVIEHGFAGQSWLTFRQALEPWRQRPQRRARHHRRLCRPLHSRRRNANGRSATGDEARSDPVPQAIHRLQHRSVRSLPDGSRSPPRRRCPRV